MKDHFEPYGPDPELYDQDGPWYDYDMNQYDRRRAELAARATPILERALEREQLLRWESELARPDYYDFFLQEVTR